MTGSGLPVLPRGEHPDLDGVLRRGEPRFDASARRGTPGRHPRVPDRVHLAKSRHVGEPDRRLDQFRLVAPGLREGAVDLRKNVARLLGDGFSCRLLGHVTRKVNLVAVHYEIGQALADSEPLDLHHPTSYVAVEPAQAPSFSVSEPVQLLDPGSEALELVLG